MTESANLAQFLGMSYLHKADFFNKFIRLCVVRKDLLFFSSVNQANVNM